jgi:hypothetical protein
VALQAHDADEARLFEGADDEAGPFDGAKSFPQRLEGCAREFVGRLAECARVALEPLESQLAKGGRVAFVENAAAKAHAQE